MYCIYSNPSLVAGVKPTSLESTAVGVRGTATPVSTAHHALVLMERQRIGLKMQTNPYKTVGEIRCTGIKKRQKNTHCSGNQECTWK
jgi:hypothetical protein